MNQLYWRHHGADWTLYDRRRIVGRVVSDATWPHMWRVRLPGGLSDIINLTRAKDAARALAERRIEQARRAAEPAQNVLEKQRAFPRPSSPMRQKLSRVPVQARKPRTHQRGSRAGMGGSA